MQPWWAVVRLGEDPAAPTVAVPAEPIALRRVLFAALAMLVMLAALPVAPAAAASTAKVVIIVGPVGDHTAHYKSDADEIATEARRWTSNVVKIVTPNATWARVKPALQGASILVYLGHGNGWPSKYAPYQTVTKDGLGLDPGTGADSTKVVYYGEDYLRSDIRLAPNAVVLLYHLCYASGNTEPGLPVGSYADSRERVDNYGAGFIGAGARAVIAEGHPAHPVVNGIRQLFATNRTMDQIFRAAPTWHGHLLGPFPAQRTPGLEYELDPDSSAPSGFYRSLVGDLSLTASKVTGTLPARTNTNPADFVVPGAAEVQAADGADLFSTAAEAADAAATPSAVIANGTHLRVTSEATPAADGTRILGVSEIGGTAKGFVRASSLVPRDSANVVIWTLDESGALLSPNADGIGDGLVVATRFSEPVPAKLVVKNAAGTTVRAQSITGDIARFTWDLKLSTGTVAPDGAYSWTLKGTDPWGNGSVSRAGTFTIDATAPIAKGTMTGTPGDNGWLVSPASMTLTATDALSGVRSIVWRLDGGSSVGYAPPAVVTTNGAHTFEYRAIDKAGIKSAWKSIALRIDTRGPTIALPLAGTAGAVAGTWRSAVTIKPSIKDNASGVATKSVRVDGAAGVPLGTDPVVVAGDGPHTVTVRSKDAAGNVGTATVSFTIDTTKPAVELPAPPATPPSISPNGDGIGEQATLPFSASEGGTLTATVTNAAAKVVRTVTLPVAAGAGTLAWDGRTATGVAVPDGRYTIAFRETDAAGNPGEPVTAPVDVYAALAGLARAPAMFFPQDADTLARSAAVTWRLVSPATVTILVLDGKGSVVRSAMTAKALPAGPQTWTWKGRTDAGAWAPRGTYRVVVTATNGTQSATQTTSLLADAFRITTSTASAKRGTPITVTATSVEELRSAPKLVVHQPGLASWAVTMTRAAGHWTATITPRKAGAAGTMTLVVKATDTAGGVNSSSVRRTLE
jgi:flagellar hook assembly protein FlgD